MARPLKIANASGFWGDQPDAAARLLRAQPDLDVITLDYLAEVSLSIMAIQRAKDPAAGYARDFLDVVQSLAGFWTAGSRVRIVTNAGGLDPLACGKATRALLDRAGLARLRIAVIAGDDVLEHLQRNSEGSFQNLETGEPLHTISERLVTANAYVGAEAVAAAFGNGADIVIAGRVADPSLTVGPCWAHFGWKSDQYDPLAGATVAGHLIECGTQACGGFSTDWLELPLQDDIGYPIAEVDADGSCVLTKPGGTGGAVTVNTVREQLLYEIGDPGRYLSPDVTVSFLTLSVAQKGTDRVQINGATGSPAPESLKVSATYRNGYRAHGMLTVFGHEAARKAQRAGEVILQKLERNGVRFRETRIECIGSGASVCPGVLPARKIQTEEAREVVLRISVAGEAREPVERFTREIAALVTCGPQGVTGYATGRPKVLPIFGYWPCLIPPDRVAMETRWL